MISILGMQRVALLIGLIVLNLVVFGVAYLFMGSSSKQMERSVITNRSEGSRIQLEIETLQDQFLQLDTQQVVFDALKEDGFFEPQGRREAEKILRNAQDSSGVSSAKVGISAARVAKNEEAQKAGYSVLESPVSIGIQSIDDMSVLQYVYSLRNDFPGHLSIDAFSLERARDVDADFLRGITLEEGADPINARLEMTWRTMVSDEVAGVNNSDGDVY